jgi:hypothetical protein
MEPGASYRFYKDGLGLPTTRTPEDGIVFFQTTGATWGAFDFNEDGSLKVT